MIRYLLQRLIAAALTFLVIITIVFFVVHSMPGSIFSSLVNQGGGSRVTQATIDRVMAKYHLDKPLPVQFLYMMSNYARFDFGTSLVVRPDYEVYDLIKDRMPITIQLNLLSVLVILPFGMFFGISMALRKGTIYDHGMSSLVILFISVPSFVLAALLQYFLAYRLGWFDIILAAEAKLSLNKLKSMVLPIAALSVNSIATISRMLRAELSEVLTSDFMLLARAKGQTYSQTIVHHALRNACVPLAATFLYLFFHILNGSIVIETIFSVPGISNILVTSINVKDYQVTLAIVYFYSLISLIAGIVTDISLGFIDPRIRMGGKKDE